MHTLRKWWPWIARVIANGKSFGQRQRVHASRFQYWKRSLPKIPILIEVRKKARKRWKSSLMEILGRLIFPQKGLDPLIIGPGAVDAV